MSTTTKQDTTTANSDVVSKYKSAAEVSNIAIRKVLSACNEGTKIIDLCKLGDAAIEAGLSTQYTKNKKMSKGIAYPTSISVNNVVCHFAPLPADPGAEQLLKIGDVVKVQVGAQIDGYASIAGETVVVGASESNPVTGKAADAITAAHYAAEAIQRLLKPGNKNTLVTEQVQKVVESFDCKPIEGMLCHEQKHNVLDGDKQIILNPTPEQRSQFPTQEFENYEVYLVDIFVTTGTGRTKQSELRTTIYKKTGTSYQLKMKAARAVFSEVSTKFSGFPFSIGSCDDQRKARMGLIECSKMGVIQPYDVFEDKQDEIVAQVSYTALVMPSGVERITQGQCFDSKIIKSDKKIENKDIIQLLSTSPKNKKKKASKKSKTASTSD